MWNSQFTQNQYAGQKGIELNFTSPDTPWEGAWKYTAYRSVQIFDIFKTVKYHFCSVSNQQLIFASYYISIRQQIIICNKQKFTFFTFYIIHTNNLYLDFIFYKKNLSLLKFYDWDKNNLFFPLTFCDAGIWRV